MIVLNGKYNFAKVMIDEIDDTTRTQIEGFLNHPAFAKTHIAIMPDCHAGKGAVVGFTMKMNDHIIPNIVGVDIGCGMLSARFDQKEVNLEALDRFIKQNIPSGFNINTVQDMGMDPDFVDGIKMWCDVIDADPAKVIRSVGSLGGGNHFIEVGTDKDGFIRVTVHSGSRNFGLRLANHFQAIAKENLADYFLGEEYKDLEFLITNSVQGCDYLEAVRFATKYASINRSVMMSRLVSFIGSEPKDVIESVHNFIGDDNIIRKGATPAREGEMIIIPFNMKDGIALCRGKGSSKYNFSAPHGAGRILSRTKAKKELSLDEFQKEMKDANIYTTTANASTLDEAPSAYKDKDIILKNIEETAELVDLIKPIYNFKATS